MRVLIRMAGRQQTQDFRIGLNFSEQGSGLLQQLPPLFDRAVRSAVRGFARHHFRQVPHAVGRFLARDFKLGGLVVQQCDLGIGDRVLRGAKGLLHDGQIADRGLQKERRKRDKVCLAANSLD